MRKKKRPYKRVAWERPVLLDSPSSARVTQYPLGRVLILVHLLLLSSDVKVVYSASLSAGLYDCSILSHVEEIEGRQKQYGLMG